MRLVSKNEVLKHFNNVALQGYTRFYLLEDDVYTAYACFSDDEVPILLSNDNWHSTTLQTMFYKCIECDARSNNYYMDFSPKYDDIFLTEVTDNKKHLLPWIIMIVFWLLCILAGATFIIIFGIPRWILTTYTLLMLLGFVFHISKMKGGV